MKRHSLYVSMLVLAITALCSCGGHSGAVEDQPESKEAKALLQGVWMDYDSEDIVFRIQGDSVFYTDLTSVPAYFKVVGDTLYIGKTTRYHIVKHSENLLWFENQKGEVLKLCKMEGEQHEEFKRPETQVLTLTEVLKKDTVVFWKGERYHLYIAVNPTKFKVKRTAISEDGLDVENVYYDNIIHLSVFKGAQQLYSSDLRRQRYADKVPGQFFSQAVVNNMDYDRTDGSGFHLYLSLCIPGDASCYQLEHIVSFDGKLTIKQQEY